MPRIQDVLNELQRRLQVAQHKRVTQKDMALLAQTSHRTIAEWMRGATSPKAMGALLNLLSELPSQDVLAILEYWKAHAPKDDRSAASCEAVRSRQPPVVLKHHSEESP